MDVVMTALRALFQAAIAAAPTGSFFAGINSVYYGKPLKIGIDFFPALAIQPVNTEYIQEGTKLDHKVHEVEIVLIFNLKDYLEVTGQDDKKIQAVEAGIQMAEKMNADHGTDAVSVAGVIQSNIRLPYTDANGVQRNACDFCTVENVRYDLRPDGRFPTYEISINVKAHCVGDRS